MNPYNIRFDDIEWQQVRPDVRQKVYCEGSWTIRLVEFETSDGPQHWCQVGHIGYVLKGSLRIDVNGKVIPFSTGDGLFLPSGDDHRHRAVWIEGGTQLLMIEGTGL